MRSAEKLNEMITCKLYVNDAMLRFEKIGYPTCFLVIKNELMSTGGKYNVLQVGMNFNTR